VVLDRLKQKTGYRVINDRMIIAETSRVSGLSEKKIQRAFLAKTSIFNQFTYEKDRSIAYLRRALAEMLDADNLIVYGASGLLIPESISHVLRVCIIAGMKQRIVNAQNQEQISEKEAVSLIRQNDENIGAWVKTILGKEDAWAASSYDIKIPTDKVVPEESVRLILQHYESGVVQTTNASRQAVFDFQLAAKAGEALADAGHHVSTDAKDGIIRLIINKHVLMLARLEDELKQIVEKVPGVKGVETSVGENFYQPDIYRKYDFQMPSKILVVDDEREFVQTLSERLILRDMGSVVAYNGESALSMVDDEEPEVMILDLRMPGIDGIEVLRNVKKNRPEIEVIILTGQGSETDRQICMELGAFAYLYKPVNIDLLSTVLKQANEKVQDQKIKKARATA
jgi:CheY-like chemotaxis protein